MNTRRQTEQASWTPVVRWIVFLLSSTSIGALILEFYVAGSMRMATIYVLLPACSALLLLMAVDVLFMRGNNGRYIAMGLLAGFVAAVAYDLFRLPFVFAKEWGLTSIVPAMPLFKVFPAFGAMILGMPAILPHYPTSAHLLGWLYHFSNGMTFGCMYVSMAGNPRYRHWAWAVLFAVGLEMAMLLTPYTSLFQIPIGRNFILVTLTAHMIFGVALGLCATWLSRKWVAATA